MAIEDNSHVQGFVAIDGNDSQKHPLDIDPEYVMGYPRSSGSSSTLAERLDTLVSIGGTQTITGEKTFTAPISGTISVAEKLQTARNLGVALAGSATAPFDGSANQLSIPVSGTLPIANGGTGATAIADIQAGKDGDGNTITSTYTTKAEHEADIAELHEVKADAGDVASLEGAVENINAYAEGQLFEYQTDSTEAYTKSVPEGVVQNAEVQSIAGKTVVWNQANQQNQTTQTKNGVTFTNNGDGTWTITGTPTARAYIYTNENGGSDSSVPVVYGHKYVQITSGVPSGVGTNGSWYVGTTWKSAANSNAIITPPSSDIDGFACGIIDIPVAMAGTALNFTMQTAFIDLTLMFGAGNEPSTVAEFQAMFPSINPAYDAGTLISAAVTGAVSRGKNLWDASKSQSGWIDPTGVVTIRGAVGSSSDIIGDYIPVTPGETICCSVNGTLYGALAYWSEYTADKSFIQRTNASTCTPTANTFFVRLCLSLTAADAVTKNATCQVERGSTATAYTPYRAPATLPIPSAVRNLPGYGWSAGTAYNYVDWQRKVYVQRVGSVDLGSLGYSGYDSVLKRFYTVGIADAVKKTEGTLNLVSSRFIAYNTLDGVTNNPNGMWLSFAGNLSLSSASYATSEDFKASLSGVMLYYELATPIETDISSLLSDDNLLAVEPGGTVSFPNSLGDDYRIPVASSVRYQEAVDLVGRVDDAEDAIAQNTEDIAANTVDIAANAASITALNIKTDITDKNVGNVLALLNGALSVQQTDTDTAYAKTIPAKAQPYAAIKEIGGKTVCWNQQIQNADFADTSYLSASNGTLSVASGVATVTCGASGSWTALVASSVTTPTVGHKYYMSVDVNLSAQHQFYLSVAGLRTSGGSIDFGSVTSGLQHKSGIMEYSSATITSATTSIYVMFARTEGDTGQFQHLRMIDLTLMFGAGNEPATAAEFEAMFPTIDPAYDAGSLKSVAVTSIVSKDSEDAELATLPIPAAVQALPGYGWSAGNYYNYVDFQRKVYVQNVAAVTLTGGFLLHGSFASTFYVDNALPGAYTNNTEANYALALGYVKQLTYQNISLLEDKNFCLGLASSVIRFAVKNTAYSTATEFNAAINTTPLVVYYRLATPIETDISAYLTDDNLLAVEPGGTISFPSQLGDDYRIPVPSDVEYTIDIAPDAPSTDGTYTLQCTVADGVPTYTWVSA